MTTTTKVVCIHETGTPDVLKIEEIPLVEPGSGEVRIRVQALGLNRADSIFREGYYLQSPIFPARVGQEVVGIVEAVGSALTEIPDLSHQPAFHRDQGSNRKPIQVTDRVVSFAGFDISKYGVFGETAILPASFVTPVPETLTSVEAASLLVPYLTPSGALVDYGPMHSGDLVLITAASSGVTFSLKSSSGACTGTASIPSAIVICQR